MLTVLLLLTLPEVDNMFHLHNDYRVEHNKGLLELDEDLCKVAQDYATLLERTGQFRHNADGTVSSRLRRAGIRFNSCGENLAKVGPVWTDQDIMNMWQNSPGHRRNILGNYKRIGIGKSGLIWCVIFVR